MRKRGKFEKQPDAVEASQEKVKSMLLQTYFTGLLSLVLCVSMFFGTSYAWFSSEVNNTTNEIYIGVLDVGLFKKTADGEEDLAYSQNSLFDSSVYWYPDHVEMETIQVKNEGDLPFRYGLSFTAGEIDGPDLLAEDLTALSFADVAQYFDVWVYAHESGIAPSADTFEAITEESGWRNVGTLTELLSGEEVLSGEMIAGTDEGQKPADTYTIALHMDKDAAVTVMGHTISLNVKLVAYQMEAGAVTSVSDVDGLVTAVAAADPGDVICLAAGEYDLTQIPPLVIEESITLQGLDPLHKPVLQVVTESDKLQGVRINADNVTLKDLVLKVPAAAEAVDTGDLVMITEGCTGVTIDGCEFSDSSHGIATYGSDVTIQNCILDGSAAQIRVLGIGGDLTIRNNRFIGQNSCGILIEQSAAGAVSGSSRIEGNVFPANQTAINNAAGVAVDASRNYWGSEAPEWTALISGENVTVNTYYTDAGKQNLAARAG